MAKKKMEKSIEGGVITIAVVDGKEGAMNFAFTALPDEIQTKLGPFGLSHKLGDSAAGKSGVEAEEAIQKVWKGLMEGDWSVRAPAAPKVSTKEITSNLEGLPEEERAKAIEVLKSLGIPVPGYTDVEDESPEEGTDPELDDEEQETEDEDL